MLGSRGLLGRRRRCRQDFGRALGIGLPYQQAHAGAHPQMGTRAARVVGADGGLDAGRFERTLSQVRLDVIHERAHGHEIVISHPRILLGFQRPLLRP